MISTIRAIIDVVFSSKKSKHAVKALAMLVVFLTTYMLILPAFTLDKEEAAEQGGIDVPAVETVAEDVSGEDTDQASDEAEAATESKTKDSYVTNGGSENEAEGKADSSSASAVKGDPLTFEGDGFTIAVDDKRSVLPDNTEVVASELLENPVEGTKAERKEAEEAYKKYYDLAQEAVENDAGGTISFAKFYDISLQSAGEEVQPGKPVDVTISYDKDSRKDLVVDGKTEVRIIHFGLDENTGEIIPEILDDKEVDAALTVYNRLKETTFGAESFSVYGVIAAAAPTGVDDLNGKTFTISRGSNYVTSTIVENMADSDGTNGLGKTTVPSEAAVWQFEQVGSLNQYKVFTSADGGMQYLCLVPNQATSYRANATLSPDAENATVFSVSQFSNGAYGFSAVVNDTTYYLDEHNGASGPGFAGWHESGQWSNDQLTLNFTVPALENNNDYMVIVKLNEDGADKYYLVENDGTLQAVEYDSSTEAVTVDDPMLWHYTGDHLHHNSSQVGYTYQALPSDSYYRYIDPSSPTGMDEDNEDNTSTDGATSGEGAGPKITGRDLWNKTAFNYTDDHKIQSKTNTQYFIGIENVNGKKKLKGQVGSEDAVEILFASAVNVSRPLWTQHAVNHIDISIKGNAAVDVPLAYGKYYDAGHNVIKEVASFEKLHLGEDLVVDPDQLGVSADDMKRSTIMAYLDDGTALDDTFYITGYSANPSYLGESAQVRIEGSFKVANLKGTPYEVVDAARYNSDESYKNDVNQERLNNEINYSVTVIKPVEFWMQMQKAVVDDEGQPVLDDEGNNTYEYIQLYDADGNPLKITADVAFSASFSYWDGIDSPYWNADNKDEENATYTINGKTYHYDGNECPPIFKSQYGSIEQWRAGGIPDHNLSGMDFKLGGDSSTSVNVYAIEVTKIVVDENGNRIRSNDAGSNKFYIYKKPNNTPTGDPVADADLVKDLDVGSFSETPDYNGYVLQHDKSVTVGSDGLGLVYDYDVNPGLYYIKEDPTSIVDQITDTSGKTWDYKNTYILTEYAWRNHGNDDYMHVSDTFTKNKSGDYKDSDFSSIPEVLGQHYGYNGTDGPYSNDFLEFYVYNVYESPKVDVPVLKKWPDFDGEGHDEYDWQASFKLQWAPLYPDETKPNAAFQDVSPAQTMTVSKSDMAGISEEMINHYLAGDDSLTQEERDRIEHISFKDLPKYGTDANGNTFRYQYSLEETSYRVTNASTGVIIYSWSQTDGYNDPENGHYVPYYPHDAGEIVDRDNVTESEADTNYYVEIVNRPKTITQNEYIDVDIEKQWDLNSDEEPDARDDSYWAEFELKRFVHTEYRDLSNMSDADRTASPVTVTIKDSNGTVIHTLQVQPNVGLYLGGNFKPHDSQRSVTFTADHPVRLANDSHTSEITATASGSNMSNALVRSPEFFVTQDIEFTIISGEENLVTDNLAKVLDTAAGTNPLPDRSFSQTVRLDNENFWKETLSHLIRMETTEGDDDNENVTYYEYYFVEKGSNPDGYAQYFRADSSGGVTDTLSGDSDHQIEHNDSIIAMNGPSNRLIVKKVWRGVLDTTGFPGVTFTLYQTTDQNGNDAHPYRDENGTVYEHIELKGHNLEWICPVELPRTVTDSNGVSHNCYYYVQEDEQSGSEESGEGQNKITTSWAFYYYRSAFQNDNGQETARQTNAGSQGYQAYLLGSELANYGGTITICNKMDNYMQLDIQKQYFKLREEGSWDNVTARAEMKKDAILGFQVIRAIKAPDGKWLDGEGNESDSPVWMDYGEEMLCGYDENGYTVVHRGDNDIFWLHDAGGDWHFRIEDNQGDATNVNAGGSGLPSYGFYIKNGEDIPVEYWYSVRETNVYKDLNRTPYPEWDWFSSITPVNAHGPNGQTMEAFPKAFHGQDSNRIANFQASDLIIDKEWIGDPAASAVYVKVWRTAEDGPPEDFTAIIAEDIRNKNNWQMYVNDPAEVDLSRNALIVRPDSNGIWEDAIKVNRALLGTLSETGRYHYFIQEVGYRTLSGEYRTNVNGTFKPLYDKWVGTASEGAYTGAPVGMNDYAGNNITIGSKGENRLKVINNTGPSTSYTVTKAFHGPQSSTGGQSSVTGKYPTDGSKQVVVELQQRYRYEKTEVGVEYVSADNANWVRKDSSEAASTWTVDWQAAESASPVSVTLPLDKPVGSVLSDEAWYGSAAAWTYTWEGLDVTKTLAEEADPANSRVAQLYYRAVEVSTPDWFSSVIAENEQNGHMAVDDSIQDNEGVQSEKTHITNEREDCILKLNKEWTGLGAGSAWPAGYVVYYQLIQNFHLAGVSADGDTPVYYFGDTVKSVNMTTTYGSGETADSVHTQATGTLEEANHNLTLTGLPMYGFFTATEADVEAAAERGMTLKAGTVYPVVYTYSVKETAVKKNGVDVDFTEQTVDFTAQTAEDGQDDAAENSGIYEATLTNEMVSAEVTKTWEDDTPYADSVKVKLYRTTEIPADELCMTTINLSFGDNYTQITDSTIVASVGDKTVELVKDGENDLWTGSVRLEKGTTAEISFTEPGVAEGYTVSLGKVPITVPDEESFAVDASGIVTEKKNGRTITVNVTWADDSSHSASYNNLFYSGWQNTNIGSVNSINGATQTFVWSGVPTTGNSLFVQLGYSGYNLQSDYTVDVTGSNHSFNNNGAELLLGDIPAGDSDVTINVNIEPFEPDPESTASITLVNNSGYGIWINQLRNNGKELGNFGGWMEHAGSNRIGNLPAGDYTVQLGVATVSQISGANSVEQWGSSENPNVNIHITLAKDENRVIMVNAPGAAGVLNSPAVLSRQRSNSMRLTGNTPVLAQSATPSATTVSLDHGAIDQTLVIEGADDYPVFSQADLVEEQILNAGNNWHYQWTGLAARDPETGAKYYYYVVEDVPGNTKTVTYTRSEENNNTQVTINNAPIHSPEYASLKVVKRVVDENNNDLDISREFTIRLKRGDKYLKWTGSNDYDWVTSQADATTWTFNNGGSVTFTGLDTGYTYTVVEDTSVGKIEIDGYTFDSATSYEVTASTAKQYEGTITNKYRLNNIDINIVKVDADDMETTLAGAQFTLNKLDPEGKGTLLTGEEAITKTSEITEEDGIASISDVGDGYYEISETKIPAGYVQTDSGKFYIKVENRVITLLAYDSSKVVTEWQGRTLTDEDKLQFNTETNTFTVGNTPGVALPHTGGSGTTIFYILGSILAIGCTVVLISRRRLYRN